MSISPLITFKAGLCDHDESTGRVKPQSTPGYIYLYAEEDLMHFCWRPRSARLDDPTLDLIMLPTDGSFSPYRKTKISGRIWVLKFSSSSQRHLFWMQSKSQAANGDPSHFSSRDLKLGEIVDSLLQGEEVDVQAEMADAAASGEREEGSDDDEDEDETMEDVEGTGPDREHRGGGGGAGANATGGDVRAEGEGAREAGADGGRASGATLDAQSIVQNFLRSMGGSSTSNQQPAQQKLFTTLQDLLTTTSTIPWIDTISEETADQLMQYLPTDLIALARDDDSEETSARPPTLTEKKDVLRRVLRSPQFTQSLASLTFALRDGGLPSVSEALNIPVQNGGYMRRGGVPLGGGEAVEAFLNGVRDTVKNEDEAEGESMDTNP